MERQLKSNPNPNSNPNVNNIITQLHHHKKLWLTPEHKFLKALHHSSISISPCCTFPAGALRDYTASTCLLLICAASSILKPMSALCNISNSSPRPPMFSLKYIYFLLQLCINWLESSMSLLIVSDRYQPLG